MARSGVVFPVLALALLVSGCFAPAPAHVRDWQGDAAAHGRMGLKTEFDLSGAPFHVTGEGVVADFTAPFWIAPSVPGWEGTPPYVFLETTLADEGEGVVRVEGTQVRVVAGTVSGLKVDRVEGRAASLRLWPLEDAAHAKPPIAWTDAQFNISSDLFHARATPITGTGLRMDSFDRAVFYGLDGTSKELSMPLILDVTSVDVLPHSQILFQDSHVHIAYARFGWAADATAGTLTTEKNVGLPRPSAVFGNDATLDLAAGRAVTSGPFRLTQAIGPDGPLLGSEVELQVRDASIDVPRGETRWVAVDYREKGYEGAALAKAVRVTGDGADLVSVSMERPPLFVEKLWEIVPGSAPWARPFAAALAVLASPAVIWLDIVDGFTCALTTCPEKHPYPAWMDPGQIGTFYVKVDASNATVGTYDATLLVEGTNHDAVSLAVRFRVVPATAPSA